MTKNLTSIIKETIKTVSGIDAIQYYRESVKEIKSEYDFDNIQPQYYDLAKEELKECIGRERFMLSANLISKSFNVGLIGVYAYGFITGDHTVTDYIKNHSTPIALILGGISAALADYWCTKRIKLNRQEKSDQKIMAEEFRKIFEMFQEAQRRGRNYDERDNNTVFSVNNIESHYATLGVKYQASITEVKRAYRKIAKATHPDINGGDKSRVEEFNNATAAYERIEAHYNKNKR